MSFNFDEELNSLFCPDKSHQRVSFKRVYELLLQAFSKIGKQVSIKKNGMTGLSRSRHSHRKENISKDSAATIEKLMSMLDLISQAQ